MNKITFPNLNLDFTIDPVAFKVGDKPIYWYGIIIVSRNNTCTSVGISKTKKDVRC